MQNSFIFLDDIRSVDSETIPAIPCIYTGTNKLDSIPEEFNMITISLDGRAHSLLDWRAAKAQATAFIQKGYQIFWHLDLGLFEQLAAPITDQPQYLTLCLALKHFRDSIWAEFRAHSIGLFFYTGTLDFSRHWTWDATQLENLKGWCQYRGIAEGISLNDLQQTAEGQRLLKLFCCDAAVEYLEMLAAQLPGDLPICACLDTTRIDDLFLAAELLSKERFEKLHRLITANDLSAKLTRQPLGFIGSSFIEQQIPEIKVGICLPLREKDTAPLHQAAIILKSHNIPFCILSEATLTLEWDGLDHLIVAPETLSAQGIRKLRGFCAAGGTIVSLTDHAVLSSFSNVISFKTWIDR